MLEANPSALHGDLRVKRRAKPEKQLQSVLHSYLRVKRRQPSSDFLGFASALHGYLGVKRRGRIE